MHRILWPTILLGMSSALAVSNVADAQESGPAEARRLFERGVGLWQQHRFEQACVSFEGALAIERRSSTLLNVARCYERREQPFRAWEACAEAERRAPQENKPKFLEQARECAGRVQPFATLAVHLQEPAPEIELVVETEAVGTHTAAPQPVEPGLAYPLEPGTFIVRARAPRRRPWTSEPITLALRENKAIEVPQLEPIPPPAVPIEDPKAEPGAVRLEPPTSRPPAPRVPGLEPNAPNGATESRSRVLRVSAVAAAGAGLVLGVTSFIHYRWNDDRFDSWQSKDRTLREQQQSADPPANWVDEAVGNASRAESIAAADQVTWGLAIASGALLAGGGALFAWSAMAGSSAPHDRGVQPLIAATPSEATLGLWSHW